MADQVGRLDRNNISAIIGHRHVFLGDDLPERLPAKSSGPIRSTGKIMMVIDWLLHWKCYLPIGLISTGYQVSFSRYENTAVKLYKSHAGSCP